MSSDLEDCLVLIEQGRLLTAEPLLEVLLNDVNIQGEVRLKLEEAKLRLEEVHSLLNSSTQEQSEEWIEAMCLFGITTSYVVLEDGLLRIKLEGSLDELPLMEQVSVLREVDLFKEWLPFCSDSRLVHSLAHNDLVAYFNLSTPVLSRDAVIRAYGVDCLLERDGLVLLLAQSIERCEGVSLPALEQGFFGLHDRMQIKSMSAVIRLAGPRAAETTIICTVDPRTPLPHFITNFVIKHVAGVLLYCHQRKSAHVVAESDSSHALRIRNNAAFYSEWLLPKIQTYYRLKGWEQPVVNCFLSHDAGDVT